MRAFAATAGCLAIGAVLLTASAAAAPVGLIEEFDVDGWAFSLAAGPDGNVCPTRIRVALGGIARKRLRRYGFITLKARVTFTPSGGSSHSEAVPIPIGLRRR